MTERKFSPPPFPTRLTEAAARHYPGVEIKVSFPDEWRFIHLFRRGNTPLYVAGLPPNQERSRGDQFYGLPPEINRTLTQYRLYKLFEPRSTTCLKSPGMVIWGRASLLAEVELNFT